MDFVKVIDIAKNLLEIIFYTIEIFFLYQTLLKKILINNKLNKYSK